MVGSSLQVDVRCCACSALKWSISASILGVQTSFANERSFSSPTFEVACKAALQTGTSRWIASPLLARAGITALRRVPLLANRESVSLSKALEPVHKAMAPKRAGGLLTATHA